MRYKTFRSLMVAGAVVAGGAGLYGLSRLGGGGGTPPVRPPDASVYPTVAPAATAVPAPLAGAGDAASPGPGAFRAMDREILERVAQGVEGDKAKDAIRGRPWKVNLYRDAGQARVNRLKIDLDRDEKWDEKWTFAADGDRPVVKRQVSPNDDEAYTLEFVLEGETWRPR